MTPVPAVDLKEMERTGIDPARLMTLVSSQGYAGEYEAPAIWLLAVACWRVQAFDVPGYQPDRRCGRTLQGSSTQGLRSRPACPTSSSRAASNGCRTSSIIPTDNRRRACGRPRSNDRLTRGRLMSQPVERSASSPG